MKTTKILSAKLKKQLIKIPRRKHHEILHHIHKKHFVSKETLFYMKEYGPKSHLVSEIVKESAPALLLSVVLTSLAGLALRSIQGKLSLLIPILIMVPALNDMIGEIGSTIASKFTTGLFLEKCFNEIFASKY